jgi:hypothetical protein
MSLRAHLVARPGHDIVPRQRPLSYLENPMNTRTPIPHDPDEPIEPDEPVDTLNFSDDGDERALAQDRPVADLGLTGGATLTPSKHEDNVSLDDLSPDTLYDESGARSPYEPGDDEPADEQLRTVDAAEIGGGIGLDEAELGRSAPLDGKPWTDEVSPTDKEREQ